MHSLQLYHMDIGDSYGEMVECMRYGSTTVVLEVTKLTTIGNGRHLTANYNLESGTIICKINYNL